MRALFLILPLMALPACEMAAPQQAVPAAADVAVPIPMDPGTMQCALLSNSNALAAASDWAMGRARAAALSGRIAGVPDQATVTSNLARYCSANGNDTVRSAAAQIGF
ncbi:hypothetical protein L0664_04155 [Octadecabacter sp. G9-8]|uniref:Uncharacterized protein n=1 Tax=Octadecabacter dasysiphoniae TaxID=2909341 RepID=A0ABS9CTH5_9RHOB|nr:hypothetical protein [Octadecabacter dasysiphoniae]MCF2870251.1 hypothetical protein [Octadecabacter dasysiphoniae]